MQRRNVLKTLSLAAVGSAFSAPAWVRAAAQAATAKAEDLAVPLRALIRKNGSLFQPVTINLAHTGPDTVAIVKANGAEIGRHPVSAGQTSFDVFVPPVSAPTQLSLSVDVAGAVQTSAVELKPVRKVTVYILPHSHHDLGYTDLQADVEEKQMNNIRLGMDLARKTASYPEGARFVWNLEVLWGADLFMQRRSAAEKAELLQSIRDGHIALHGSYANELTGLCRPEELVRLFKYSTELGAQAGVKVDSAMMSDVPGFSWGTVAAMQQAGIRYFSAAPNFFDRIGDFMVAWQDKPFWWVSPSGKEKILFWVPWTGYAMSHVNKVGPAWVSKYQDRLDTADFPYDISYIRWSGHGDNAAPDPEISDFTRDWNTAYEWPRFEISSTSKAFSAFEQRYGGQIPTFRGDLTPYWEDGAGSSALETAMSRNAADRLTQAGALSAMLAPARYNRVAFDQAWRDVLLYSEHTWGAYCSVSDSENPFTTKQWDYKRDFAVKAEQRAQTLIAGSLPATATGTSVQLHNCTSWDRSELVLLSREQSAAGDRVQSSHGRPVPSQRLSTGELAILAPLVPAFGTVSCTVSAGTPHPPSHAATFAGNLLRNETLQARLDPATGDITELLHHGLSTNLVDQHTGPLNQYLFMAGNDTAHLQHSGTPRITVEDPGPLVVTVRVESSAPGCRQLIRRLRLAAGTAHLELLNTVDKERAPLNPHPGKGDQGSEFAQHGNKESVQFGFPFAVPDGKMTMDVALAVMRPEADQLPGACRNWLPVGRWIDISGPAHGVTWATLDAPLVELGGITATMLGSQRDPSIWRKHIDPTQNVFSWVMNNHWGTNYRAYQQGPVTFRYAIRPHAAEDPAAAARFSTGLSQPLVVSVAASPAPATPSLLRVSPAGVLVSALKPSDDGKAWIVRLFAASGKPEQATLTWADPHIGKTSLSNTAEQPLAPVGSHVPLAGYELVTVRVERS